MLHGAVLEGVVLITGHPVQFRPCEIESFAGVASAARTGCVVGAALGGVTGAIGGAALSHLCVFGDCPQPTAGEQAGAALTGAMMGGMTVGLAGLMIAAPIRKWTTVYRAQQSPVHPAFRGTSIFLEVAC